MCPTNFNMLDISVPLMLSGSTNTKRLITHNISLTALFLNTLSQCSSLNDRDQVSQPYKMTGK
jgi:hypothetical protein